jgi:hypothetical protein
VSGRAAGQTQLENRTRRTVTPLFWRGLPLGYILAKLSTGVKRKDGVSCGSWNLAGRTGASNCSF